MHGLPPRHRRSLYVTEVVILLFVLLLLLLLSLFNLGWTLYQFDEGQRDYRQLLWVDVALSAGSVVVSLAALARYAASGAVLLPGRRSGGGSSSASARPSS